MKPGDLVEWNDWNRNGKYSKRGIVIRKSSFFGWVIYFPTRRNKIDHLNEGALKKIQQLAEEK